MTSDRKQPGVAFWATVVVVVGLAYVASVGPGCWVSSRTNYGASTVSVVYRPLAWGMAWSERVADAVSWYSGLCAVGGWAWSNGTWDDSDPLGRWLYSPGARAIYRNLGVEE